MLVTRPIWYFCPTMEVNGAHQLSGYQHSSKYVILWSTEDKLIQVLNNLRVSK